MANNQNDRTPQNVSGQTDQQKSQQGMPKETGTPSKEGQPKTGTDRDMQGQAKDQARSSDENQKR